MHMRKVLSFVILAELILTCVSSLAQGFKSEPEFDCGTITSNGSGAMVYQDYGHGFSFEFPSNWMGNRLFLRGPAEAAQILVNPMTANSDPKFYFTEPAKPTGSETINGLTWTVLTWEQGGRGYYTYSHGVAIEFFAAAFGKDKAVDPAALVALQQVLSTFTFFDDPYRIDRQLDALRVGQKLGDLTITRIIPGAGGFEHPLATVEFAGQLRISGDMVLPSPSMGGGWSPYQLYPDDQTRQSMPHLKCPVENLISVTKNTVGVGLRNQQFTNEQFARVPSIRGSHLWYEAETIIVVDKIAQNFSYLGETSPGILAKLVKVISKKEGP
jgi:hypothetical protein